jgi:hypothetical protein
MKSLSRLALGLTVAPLFAGAAMANLVANGGFEGGVSDFSSDYTSVSNNVGNCVPPGVYTVGNSPIQCHSSWADYAAHSGENQLIVNGADAGGSSKAVYISDPVGVVTGGVYHLSLFGASSFGESPAKLDIRINGVSLGELDLSANPGEWLEFQTDWTAAAADLGNAKIEIFDLDEDFSGNDFSLDDISLEQVSVPAPEPITLSLLGAGLAGLGLRRRRRA